MRIGVGHAVHTKAGHAACERPLAAVQTKERDGVATEGLLRRRVSEGRVGVSVGALTEYAISRWALLLPRATRCAVGMLRVRSTEVFLRLATSPGALASLVTISNAKSPLVRADAMASAHGKDAEPAPSHG